MGRKLKKKEIKEFVDRFLNIQLVHMDVIYGQTFREWWECCGKKEFFKYAENNGIEFTEQECFNINDGEN